MRAEAEAVCVMQRFSGSGAVWFQGQQHFHHDDGHSQSIKTVRECHGNRKAWNKIGRLVTGLVGPGRHMCQHIGNRELTAEAWRRAFRQRAGPEMPLDPGMQQSGSGCHTKTQRRQSTEHESRTGRQKQRDHAQCDCNPVWPAFYQTERTGRPVRPPFQGKSHTKRQRGHNNGKKSDNAMTCHTDRIGQTASSVATPVAGGHL